MTRLLVTADDFGLDRAINTGIARAYDAGVVVSASAIAGSAHQDEAAALARERPEIELGLHLRYVQGRPLRNPKDVPSLVGADGCFRSSVFRMMTRLPRLGDLRSEAEAQYEAFVAAFDREPAFVNTHQHTHILPLVLAAVIGLCRAHGIRAVRLPAEHRPARLTRRARSWLWPASTLAARIVTSPALALARLKSPDCMLGGPESGRLTTAALTGLLDRLPSGTVELVVHPAAGNGDLRALLDPGVQVRLAAAHIERICFRDL